MKQFSPDVILHTGLSTSLLFNSSKLPFKTKNVFLHHVLVAYDVQQSKSTYFKLVKLRFLSFLPNTKNVYIQINCASLKVAIIMPAPSMWEKARSLQPATPPMCTSMD